MLFAPLIAALAALAALSSACSDSGPAPAPPASESSALSAPSVVSHDARVDEDNGQTVFVSVVLSAPARAAVEYENEFAGKFRTALSETAVEHVIPVVRLRGKTTYQYAVGVENPDGSLAYGARGEFVTGELPGALATVRRETSGESSQDLIVANYRTVLKAPNPEGYVVEGYIVMLDALGYAVWNHESHTRFGERAVNGLRLLPGGNIMYQVTDCCVIEITPLGERVSEIIVPNDNDSPSQFRIHHDFLPPENGRIIYIGRYDFTFDDSANGGDAETTAGVDTVNALDLATGEMERLWDPMDFWDIRDPNQRRKWYARGPNWLHMNSLSKTSDGGYIVSLRNINQVVSLSPDFKTTRWRLGGPDSDFDFPDPSDRFRWQHTANELPSGNILLFDNRARPPGGGDRYSRALELRLDSDAKTAVKAWEFSLEPRLYSEIVSSAYRLDNGNTLVNFGLSPDSANIPIAIVEVDARGREVFKMESVDPPLAEISFRGPERYRVYPGPKSIMGETMLRAPTR